MDRPALDALHAFVAVGRNGSFRDAALDLGVTPSAVSHRMKALETALGVSLFVRGVRRIGLSPAGQTLYRRLSASFAEIDRAIDETRLAARRNVLRITTLPLFAGVWLSARLPLFEAEFPALSIAVDTDNRVVDLEKGEADVAIRNVPAPTPGMHARKLLDLRATPLCAPALAARLKSPRDLSGATLIGLSVGRAGWPDWLAAVGAADIKPKRTLTFDAMPAAIEAAAQGRGVMLGLLPLLWDAPASERLVAPFDIAPLPAGGYYVVCRKEDRATPTVRAFIDWLIAEMHADERRLRRIERIRLKKA